MQSIVKLVGAVYAFLWRNTAGRPWTYEIRDWTTRHPLAAAFFLAGIIGGALAAQLATPFYLGAFAIPIVVFVDFLALLAGHLYWDTAGAYIKPRRYVTQYDRELTQRGPLPKAPEQRGG